MTTTWIPQAGQRIRLTGSHMNGHGGRVVRPLRNPNSGSFLVEMDPFPGRILPGKCWAVAPEEMEPDDE